MGASFLVLMNYGIFYSYGVFFKPLIAEFGWSRAETSLAFSFYLVTYSTTGILMGWLSDRNGPRLPIFLAALLIGGGLAALSWISSLWALYLFFGLVAALGHGASWIVPVSTVVRWFERRRGMAMGIVTAGMGVGTLIFPFLANYLISSLGWRQAFLVVGVVAFTYNAVAAFILRRGPDSMGLAAYGAVVGAVPVDDNPALYYGYTLKEAVSTYAFWSIYFCVTLGFASYALLLVHLVPFATDQGIDPAGAVGAVAFIGVGALLGRTILGMVSDRIGRRGTLRLAYVMNALAITGLVVGLNLQLLYTIAFAVGFFGIGGSVVLGPLFGEMFGQLHLGKILGAFMTCGAAAGFAGPYTAGYLFDLTGNYSAAFMGAAGIAITAAILSFLIRTPRG
ncbi:MAG: MFS transporter [Dehalococcoidia bacterium]|nr:MFS transporter [Dehalococcoidia bacterium]